MTCLWLQSGTGGGGEVPPPPHNPPAQDAEMGPLQVPRYIAPPASTQPLYIYTVYISLSSLHAGLCQINVWPQPLQSAGEGGAGHQ